MISDKHFIKICEVVASASYCNNYKVGAIIVKDSNIISIGYNGTAHGSCNDCEDENGITKIDVLHAESNAISKCSRSTLSSDGATIYCTLMPCIHCAKLIKQAGIRRVVYKEDYKDSSGLKYLINNNIKTEKCE